MDSNLKYFERIGSRLETGAANEPGFRETAPYLGERSPYHFAWLAVVLSAWYLDLGSSIFALVVEAVGVWYFFIPPHHSFRLQQVDFLGLLGFVVLSGLVVMFGETNRRSVERRKAAEGEAAREVQARLAAEEQSRSASEVARERALAEEKFRGLLESAPDAVVIVDSRSQIVLVNAQTEALFGYQRSELLGQPVDLLIPERSRPRYRERLQKIFAQPHHRVIGSLELRGLRKDGSECPVEVSLAPLETQGKVLVSTAIRDISARIAAQETVKAQAGLLDAANDAIWMADSSGRIVYWNGGAARLYGWSHDEAVGQVSRELLRTEFPVPLEEIAAARQTGGWEGDVTHQKRDGTTITAHSRWTSLRDAQGHVSDWLEVNRDITARRRAEEKLRGLSGRLPRLQEEEQRRIGRELHDSVGQSLVALKMGLESLEFLLGAECSQPQRETLSQCLDAVQQSIREVRTMSYLLHPPMLSEGGLPMAVSWYVEGFAKRTGIAASAEIAGDLGRLPADMEMALFRVVQESLTNVHRHSASPTAHIRLLRRDGRVTLEVEDQGKGMPAEVAGDGGSVGVLGVGLQGMRERMHQLGGKLEVRGGQHGTLVRAIVPYVNGASSSSGAEETGSSADGTRA